MKTIKVLGTVLLGACLSHATIILTPGNNPSGTEQNALLNQGVVGNTITGTFNGSAAIADFLSTQSITSPANGQARIEASTGLLTNLTISLEGGYLFGDLIFALNPPQGNTPNPLVTISAVGTVSGNQQLASLTPITTGNQFFTITTAGEKLSSVSIQSTGLGDIRQVRFSEITAPGNGGGGGGGGSQVPEPSTWALLGSGLVLVGLRRKLS